MNWHFKLFSLDDARLKLYIPSGWGSPHTGGTGPACTHTASRLAFQTRAFQRDHALQRTHTHTHTVSHPVKQIRPNKHAHTHTDRCVFQLQVVCTCASGEVRNVRVFEDLRVFEHLGQPPQTWTAHDSHFGSHLRVGLQPISCGVAFLIAVAGRVRKQSEISHVHVKLFPVKFKYTKHQNVCEHHNNYGCQDIISACGVFNMLFQTH